MKRLMALLLALLLALPAFAWADDLFVSYTSNFSAGTDGWYARSGDGLAALEVTSDGLKITGRSGTWNSPGRDFPLTNGKKYKVQVKVLQEQEANVEFILSAAHTKHGAESYSNLGRATAPKGRWVTITATYTATDYDKYVLYVETNGNPNLDFTIKDFEVVIDEIAYDMTLPSLKELYADYFDVGNALGRPEALNKDRMAFVASQFNILTHGNELKPDFVLNASECRKVVKDDPTAVAVSFSNAKPMLDFCQKNGIKVHGHVLVWHSQTPDWFFRENYDRNGDYVSREVMLGRLDNYIRLIMEHMDANYPGLIVSWDVVNEAVADGSTKLRESNWTRVVGDDFVNRAFEIARKHAPADVKLYYNDYNTPQEPKLTGILKLLESLVAEGNIDGYGFQCHYQAGWPSLQAIETAIQKVSDLGLQIRISELDIEIGTTSRADLSKQAERYRDLMKLFVKYADNIDAVQIWGLTDDQSWKADKNPLIFDGKALPKPAFNALVSLAEGLKSEGE